MSFTKKNIILKGLVMGLFVVCAVEGFVIYKHSNRHTETIDDHNVQSLSSQFNNPMQPHRKGNWQLFDRFFDDDFFAGSHDPFKEMDRLRRQMHDMMDQNMKGSFNDSWDSWFGNRFLGKSQDMEMTTKDTGKNYVITLSIPHLKDDNLNISIDKDGITVKGDYSQLAEKKDDTGHVISKKEVHRTLSEHFSIPTNSDAHHARVDKKSDRIEITLPKLS